MECRRGLAVTDCPGSHRILNVGEPHLSLFEVSKTRRPFEACTIRSKKATATEMAGVDSLPGVC